MLTDIQKFIQWAFNKQSQWDTDKFWDDVLISWQRFEEKYPGQSDVFRLVVEIIERIYLGGVK